MEVPEPDIIIHAWYPRGVKRVIASGSNSFIGLIDENTVLKYPQLPLEKPPGQLIGLGVEEQIFGVLGQHRRIIGFLGKHEEGLLLEHMPNGSAAEYLYNADPQPPIQERLEWALQAAEAVAYIHTKRVIHCDVSAGNLLFDKDLNVKLCDFQGRLLHPDGTIHLNGDSAEGTDIFALGSAIYFIIKGHPPFPELDPWKDELEIVSRFKERQFYALNWVPGGDVVKKCWAGDYESADEVVHDLRNSTTSNRG
ncbi:kinase-like protein [Cadophora sp. DSE1049]|nr:kinase-like protein [Cadophora sp. DSE1049]